MPTAEDGFEPAGNSSREREYIPESAARHRSRSSTRRAFFFVVSSLWGFIAGVAGLLVAMSASGQSVAPGAGVSLGLIPAATLAMAGGLVIAAAYKEAKRRSR